MLSATVSGSFHRHMADIYWAVAELQERRVHVLSPADPRIVDQLGSFLFVASDWSRSVRLVQDRHLESIRGSDFLWLVCPDGYVGSSAAMEIGAAVISEVPVFATARPTDETLRRYVHIVPDMASAIEAATSMSSTARRMSTFLLDPEETMARAQHSLDEVKKLLRTSARTFSDDTTKKMYRSLAQLAPLSSSSSS